MKQLYVIENKWKTWADVLKTRPGYKPTSRDKEWFDKLHGQTMSKDNIVSVMFDVMVSRPGFGSKGGTIKSTKTTAKMLTDWYIKHGIFDKL